MKFGLLLPHFGEYADKDAILDGARLAEGLGFDSVWVRDHLLFEPHGEFESAATDFYEPLTVLTAVGAVTEQITLGTATLIPYRHPLVTAFTLASMTHLFGDRIIAGWGAGTFDHEFDAVGMGGIFRPELVESNARIFEKVWAEDNVTYSDDHFSFENVNLYPKPTGKIPFWYGGATPASARRAAEYCDGWMPGRITLKTIEKRVAAMAGLVAENGRPMPTVGVVPPTTIATTEAEAWAGTSVEGLLKWANDRGKWWVKPESGVFETAADIEGSLIAGTPDQVTEATAKFADVGVDHLVFDLRLSYDRWLPSIELLGKEVIPHLR
ncbi:MAG: LLM class flavin-dependent oxidoreductase [Acidimicrobiia bacterium]|nr:LLM class flavin-dependent oxidoreductase [Acidimicrobiia bacterium]MDH5422469.1 LLM class flavin-dependent oxidoreductase [Acidimicrobiia bacterium]